jgi:hypothetical protein
MTWVTNVPEIAMRLKAADEEHARARNFAKDFDLVTKLEAYKRADEARAKVYDEVRRDVWLLGEKQRDAMRRSI